MKNKNMIMAIAGGVLIAAAIIAWLMFGGSAPANVDLGNGVSAKLNASLKNSVISREKDGKKLWEFKVAEVINDKVKNMATLKGITGKVYRTDGSYIDITAEAGTMTLGSNDFALEGKVTAVLSSGGKLVADKVSWKQKGEVITATGNVKMDKDEYHATAKKAVTTSAFKKVKLEGDAKVEKGGEH